MTRHHREFVGRRQKKRDVHHDAREGEKGAGDGDGFGTRDAFQVLVINFWERLDRKLIGNILGKGLTLTAGALRQTRVVVDSTCVDMIEFAAAR